MTNCLRQLAFRVSHVLLVFLLTWNFHCQLSVSAQEASQSLKGEKGDAGTPGKDGKDCIPPLPQPGSPVHIGGGRYKILEGAQGPSGSGPFNPAFGGKGEKGDMGQAGPVGPVGPPGVCDSSQCGTSQGSCSGSKDCLGQKGEPGSKGESGQRGPRGSPGIDGRGLDRIIHYGYGAIIVETANDLEEIADYMPGGSIVLVRRGTSYGPELYMKVGYPENLWRQISMGFGKEVMYRKLSTPQKSVLKVARFKNSAPLKSTNKKLVLVVLEEPWRGNIQARVASYRCNERAKAVGLSGFYQPFLDSAAQRLEFTVPEKFAHFPIVNSRGEILFKNWTSIFRGEKKSRRVQIQTFDGLNVLEYEPWRPKFLWVGTSNEESGDNEVSCRDWTSSKPLDFGMGLDMRSEAFLKDATPLPCGNAYYIACIQVSL